eukprot:24519-Prymnesium_polylepis.1
MSRSTRSSVWSRRGSLPEPLGGVYTVVYGLYVTLRPLASLLSLLSWCSLRAGLRTERLFNIGGYLVAVVALAICSWDQPRPGFGPAERTMGLEPHPLIEWEKPWLAFAVLVMLLRQARHLHLLHSIGPLYLMFTRLFADVLKFATIVLVVIVAFAGSFYRLFEDSTGCQDFYHQNAFAH